MKFEIENLGVIKQAEIELKPLTIFIGHNNRGKTWSAYALSTILGPYAMEQYSNAYTAGHVSLLYPPLEKALQEIAQQGHTTIDLVQFANQYGETYFQHLAHFAQGGMQEFMGTKRVSFRQLAVRLDFDSIKESFLQRLEEMPFERKLFTGRPRSGALLNLLKEKNQSALYFYTTAQGNLLDEVSTKIVREFLIFSVFRLLHNALSNSHYPYAYIFPAERTTYASLPLATLEDSLTIETVEGAIHQRQKKGYPQAESVASFVRLLLDAFLSGQFERQKQASKHPMIQKYIELAELLEKGILGGGVDFSLPEPDPLRTLLFHPTGTSQLEMPVVSSMVKELSALVLYLRYLAQPHERIIIDEPEMNLHPKTQVQLMEFLGMLVNAGLQILITTHSPYMVDHLVNLIKAAEQKNKAAIEKKFYLKNAEAFISKEQVSVNLFENGTCRPILDNEGLIDWVTFSQISDEISDLYFEIDEVAANGS